LFNIVSKIHSGYKHFHYKILRTETTIYLVYILYYTTYVLRMYFIIKYYYKIKYIKWIYLSFRRLVGYIVIFLWRYYYLCVVCVESLLNAYLLCLSVATFNVMVTNKRYWFYIIKLYKIIFSSLPIMVAFRYYFLREII